MEPATTATSSYYGVSSRLAALAQQLRLYKSPPSPSLDDVAEEMEVGQDSAGKVVSQFGFEESIAPITKDHERFRPKRAYVLICIFEGDEGDLRVILTKRSSRLPTLTLEKFHCQVVKRRMIDDDEEDGMTATREAEEEIGVCYLFERNPFPIHAAHSWRIQQCIAILILSESGCLQYMLILLI